MPSPAKNISPDKESHHMDHHHHHQYHHVHDQHHPNLHGHGHHDQEEPRKIHSNPHEVVMRKEKPRSVKALKKKENDDHVILKVCADCKTSKTPLWRSGPAGAKSLCNACGIRRKRKRRGWVARNGLMKDKQMEEKVLFLLQRNFAGEEETEAAVLLMALSCGLCLRT